jgi:hypothetical protein
MSKKAKKTETNGVFVSNEDFVMGWQNAKTKEEAIEKLGDNAPLRAQRLRKKGVDLKRFAAPKQRIDVGALNKLIK